MLTLRELAFGDVPATTTTNTQTAAHAMPNRISPVVRILLAGAPVEVLEKRQGWARVRWSLDAWRTEEGWIDAATVGPAPRTSPRTSPPQVPPPSPDAPPGPPPGPPAPRSSSSSSSGAIAAGVVLAAAGAALLARARRR